MSSPSDIIVYCAGPMFSPGDLWEMQRIAEALEIYGFTTYLPQRDGVEMGDIMKMANDPNAKPPSPKVEAAIGSALMRGIFALDIYQLLSRCHAIVFNMNGRVPDGGSVAETAAAFTANKPVLIYKDDPITLMNGLDNPMIMGLSETWKTTDEVDKIPQALGGLINAWEKDFKPAPLNPGPYLQSVLEYGEAVSKLLPEDDAGKLIKELMDLSLKFPVWQGAVSEGS